MIGEQPSTDRSRTRRHRWTLIGGLVGVGAVVAVRLAVSEWDSGQMILLQRLVLGGVIVALIGLLIRTLANHLPAHPIPAAIVGAVSAAILSVPAFVAFNILFPTRGGQAHMWGDVEALDRFFHYVFFGVPGAVVLGLFAGALIAVRRRRDRGDEPRFVKH